MAVERTEEVSGFYVVEGPLRIRISKGSVELTGKSLSTGDEAIIPYAKATLMEAQGEAEVKVRGGGSLTKLDRSTIPREWMDFVDSVSSRECTVFTLGYVDSGKTFFVTYTANKALRDGLKVSVVDCDIGQSDVGPPTTIGLGLLKEPVVFLEEVNAVSAYFVGSTSLAGHLLPMVVGTAKLVEEARRLGSLVLIDTPGMVYGGPARAYQLYTVEAVNPDLVVALQRNDELKHLTKQLKSLGFEVVELPASPWVKQRNRSDRRLLRERAFYNYFAKKGVVKQVFNLREASIVGSFLGSGCPASPEVLQAVEAVTNCKVEYCEISEDSAVLLLADRPRVREVYAKIRSCFTDKTVKLVHKGFYQGLVVGLLGVRGRFLDIGVLRELDLKEMRAVVETPLREIGEVKALKMGCVRLDDEYREVERLEPGYV